MPSPLIAVPNVSEGRRRHVIDDLSEAVVKAGARVLDVHRDAAHNRSVFTISGREEELVEAAPGLARACHVLDLTTHSGVHPRLGVLDVFPFVILDEEPGALIACARRAATAIWEAARIPVYLYGEAALRQETSALPDIRAGGLARLRERAGRDLPPDVGSSPIDPRYGVVCVGARPPLIAFNVWLNAPHGVAQNIAARVRSRSGGSPGIRALGLELDSQKSQVSLNLTSPDVTGIDDAFAQVASWAKKEGASIIGTEIVGLPLERHLPDPKREAARLLMEPGRSLESVLRN